MKERTNLHRREVVFKEGDMLLLKLMAYRQVTIAKRMNEKLAQKYYGPFEVVKRFGEVAYELLLPKDARIHPC